MKHINKECNHCKVNLVLDDNYARHRLRKKDYICKTCYNEYQLTNTMFVNGKYVSSSHVLFKPGRYKTFEDAIDLAKPGGQITKIGWFMKRDVKANFDNIVRKNLKIQGSFSHNFKIWQECIRLLSKSPLVGIGASSGRSTRRLCTSLLTWGSPSSQFPIISSNS